MAKKQVKTETTAEAYLVEVIDPILEEIKNDISQTRADQKTIANTLTMHKDSLQESFEAMKQQRAQGKRFELLRKEDMINVVKEEVEGIVQNLIVGFNMEATVSDYCYQKFDEIHQKMEESLKRPPLMEVHMNLNAKVLCIILAIIISTGISVFFWFINTPMYLGHELYKSQIECQQPHPGSGYHLAYQEVKAGKRKDAKARIKLSRSQEADFRLYADTLRSILKDSTIYINGIRYGEYERLIDYTDRTDIIKSAHFRKDGSIRITDDQRMITLEDARSRKDIKWTILKKE